MWSHSLLFWLRPQPDAACSGVAHGCTLKRRIAFGLSAFFVRFDNFMRCFVNAPGGALPAHTLPWRLAVGVNEHYRHSGEATSPPTTTRAFVHSRHTRPLPGIFVVLQALPYCAHAAVYTLHCAHLALLPHRYSLHRTRMDAPHLHASHTHLLPWSPPRSIAHWPTLHFLQPCCERLAALHTYPAPVAYLPGPPFTTPHRAPPPHRTV